MRPPPSAAPWKITLAEPGQQERDITDLRRTEAVQMFVFQFVVALLRARGSTLPSLLNEPAIMALHLADLANPLSPR